MTDKTVRTWKASPKELKILKDLEDANIEENESARVRAGLRLLHETRIPKGGKTNATQ